MGKRKKLELKMTVWVNVDEWADTYGVAPGDVPFDFIQWLRARVDDGPDGTVRVRSIHGEDAEERTND